MNITNNISGTYFTGRYINTRNVLKKLSMGEYSPYKVNLIEMDYSSEKDARALNEVYADWQDALYTPMICRPMNNISRKLYALTSQDGDFAEPNSKKILALADVRLEDSQASLKFIQVDTKILNDVDDNYNHVGQELMYGVVDDLRNLGIKELGIFSLPAKRPFYKAIFPNMKDKPVTCENSSNIIVDI